MEEKIEDIYKLAVRIKEGAQGSIILFFIVKFPRNK